MINPARRPRTGRDQSGQMGDPDPSPLCATAALVQLAGATAADAQVVLRNARRALTATTGRRAGRLRRAVNDLAATIKLTTVVAAQARSRLAAVMPDSATRVVILHDRDARPIVRGRLGRPVEFGYKAQVVDNTAASSSTTPWNRETRPTPHNWPQPSPASPADPADHPVR